MTRYLICGGRNPDEQTSELVWNWVMTHVEDGDVVIHGAARGVDTLAMIAAQALPGVKHAPFAADWHTHGKAAGPIRNQRMLDEGKPDFVIAFPGGKGTADMMRRAEAAGVPVTRVRHAHTRPGHPRPALLAAITSDDAEEPKV